jgi:hypothetical protein
MIRVRNKQREASMRIRTLPNGRKALFIGKLNMHFTSYWDLYFMKGKDRFWLNVGKLEIKYRGKDAA